MLDSNIIKVSLRSSKTIKTIPLHRWDTGMKLEFEGIDIPLNTTCQFETGNGEAMLQLVDTETKRVDIPNDLLGQYCYQDIRAHLYVTNSSYGMTVYDIFIPVLQREQPADHISPDNTQTIEEWITEQVETVDEDRQSIENMSATASVDNNTGTPAVTVTKTTVSDHVNLDFAFVNIKGAKGEDGADGADGVTPSFSIGTVSQVSSMHPPWVTITGTDEEPVLNFGLPKGEDGEGVKLRNVNIYEDSGATRGKITIVGAVVGYITYDIDLYNIKGADGIDGTEFLPTETVSGSPATFTDGAKNVPVDELVANIVAAQDLHGYDKPWAAGAGKNKYSGDQTVDLGGTNARTISININSIPAGTYYFSSTFTGTASNVRIQVFHDSTLMGSTINATGGEITASDTITRIYAYITTAEYNDGKIAHLESIQIESGSSATSYEPYSNICPISGWTQAEIAHNGDTDTIPFGQTVYGGSLNVSTGVLTIDRGYIASYNGETIAEPWISSMDEYVSGNTPTIGAQVVYPVTPTTVQLTPAEVRTVLGNNSISANTGSVSVRYRADIGLYIDNLPKELPAVTSADNGKVLGVSSGVWTKVAAPSGLPAATSADEGKLLGVDSNGDWGKTNAFAEEVFTFTLSDNTTVTKTFLVKV